MRSSTSYSSLASRLIATSWLLAVGCGGETAPKAPDTGGTGEPQQPGERITGQERLGWIQSGVRADSFSFTLYVDNAGIPLKTVSCSRVADDRYDCSAALPPMSPGPHLLELSATADSRESPRSSALAVVVVAPATLTAQPSAAPSDPSNAGAPDRPSMACARDGSCYVVESMAGPFREAGSLAARPDGGVLLVVDDERILSVGSDGRSEVLQVAPPCSLPRGPFLAAIAPSPLLPEDRTVLTAWICSQEDPREMLVVAVHRALGGVLGETRVYTLMPVSSRSVRLLADLSDRLVVRARDQKTERIFEIALSGPAHGPSVKVAADARPEGPIAASDVGIFFFHDKGLSLLGQDSSAGSRTLEVGGLTGQQTDQPIALAATQALAGPGRLWVADRRALRRYRLDPERVRLSPDQRVDLSPWGDISDVAVDEKGAVFVLVRRASGRQTRSVLLRLRPAF